MVTDIRGVWGDPSRDAITMGGSRAGAGAGPCDADDAPVLLQESFFQPADEPAFWDLRPAHRPYSFVSILGSWVVFIRVRWRGLGMVVMGSGWLHRAALSVRARRVQREGEGEERAMNGSMAEWWV